MKSLQIHTRQQRSRAHTPSTTTQPSKSTRGCARHWPHRRGRRVAFHANARFVRGVIACSQVRSAGAWRASGLTPDEIAFVDAACRRILWDEQDAAGPTDLVYGRHVDGKIVNATASREGADNRHGVEACNSAARIYRNGIAAAQALCLSKYGLRFQQLSGWRQLEVLAIHEHDSTESLTLGGSSLFDLMVVDAVEAFFSAHSPWSCKA